MIRYALLTLDATTNDGACPFCIDASYDAPTPQPPDAIPPPQVDCSDGGAGASLCPLPRSICANVEWLEYFDNGACEDGGCHFDAILKRCAYGCVDGGCSVPPPLTAPAP